MTKNNNNYFRIIFPLIISLIQDFSLGMPFLYTKHKKYEQMMQLRVSIFFSNILLFLNLLNVDRIALSKTKNGPQWSTTTHSNPQQSTKIQEKFQRFTTNKNFLKKIHSNPQWPKTIRRNQSNTTHSDPQSTKIFNSNPQQLLNVDCFCR